MSDKIYSTGEIPGAGKYLCLACPFIMELLDGEELQICPVCGALEWTKID